MSMAETTKTVRTVAALRAAVAAWRRDGDSVGVIPTMGALHRGHISLVEAARASCRRTIASVAWIGEWLARIDGKYLKPFSRISHFVPRPEVSAAAFGSVKEEHDRALASPPGEAGAPR